MQPTAGDLHVNQSLTNVSIAFMQDDSAFIATKVFPNIPVQKQTDVYWVYDRGDFNRDEMQVRAAGTESAGGGWNVTQDTYHAPIYAFHKDIADPIRANADSQFNLDSEATRFITNKGLIKREKLFVATYFRSGVWTFNRSGVAANPVAGVSVLKWSDANSDPISDIRTAKRTALESTGMRFNKLTLGQAVFDILLDHPDVIDRLKYGARPNSNPVAATAADLASLFMVDEVLVASAVENVAKEGQPAVHQFIAGNGALLTYAPATPGLMTASAGYTFSWTGYLGAANDGQRISMFRQEHLKSDRVEVEMAFVQKLTAADLGMFFDAII